ncbi:MAG: hypothetical protein H0V12_11485 [Chloroflexi bacterium]|nr:hypothetical protein [Chloroflexota bacterium]
MLIAASLGLLALLPRVAFAAAVGSVGLAIGAIVILIVYFAIGVRMPIGQPWLALAVGVWVASYAVAAWWAVRGGGEGKPWRRPDQPLAAGRGRSG